MRATIQWVIALVLLACLGLAVAGLVLTRALPANPFLKQRSSAGAGMAPQPVDESPFNTARDLSALATTDDEKATAEQAMRLGDSEIDLAFSTALRDAREHTASPTPKARKLQDWVNRAQQRETADQQRVAELKRDLSAARGARQQALQQELELAQAQLSLDQDEVSDAQRDLAREGGDEEARLKQSLDDYEKSADRVLANFAKYGNDSGFAGAASSGSGVSPNARGLLGRFEAWNRVRRENALLVEARSASLAREARLTRTHDVLQQHIRGQQSPEPGTAPQAAHPPASPAKVDTAAALASIQQLKLDQQDLSDLDRRISLEQELGQVYQRWIAQAGAVKRSALHRLLQSIFWILVLLLLAVAAEMLISRFFSGLSLDRKRLHTIRSVLHVATRGLAAVLILIVAFGPPKQLGTMLALAGAGLTVALKDFIVGFLGWFVLIGRNGMRSGDWVEINGVQGKVLAIGLLHTVILETGNWTDAGHPTGRKVTFVNSFAIEGHYFNFSTTGQWLWDEVQVGLPVGVNPYPVLNSLQQVATTETEANARLAEREWKRAMAGADLRDFSAAPVITVRPTDTGLNVVVRYIVRADEREELRLRLYRAAFDMLVHQKALPEPEERPAGETTPA